MQRRHFVRRGLAWMAAPAALPLLPEGLYALPGQELGPSMDTPWASGGPVEAVRAGEVRLSSNENPLGISESATRAGIEALRTVPNRYPSADATLPLRSLLGERHGVTADHIVMGAGSTELMQVAIQSLQPLGPGYRVVAADPTFDAVQYYSDPSGIEVVRTALTSDYQHDLEAMVQAARQTSGPVLIYLCNPNNPTGTVTSCDDVAGMIDRLPGNVHVLIDEAYFEFVEAPGYRTFERLPLDNPNVVVIRTFSKVHGMAGLRLGYAIAHEEAVPRLSAFASRNNANHVVLAAGAASLEDAPFLRSSVESNARAKTILIEALDDLGIEHIPSHTNFAMHRIRGDLGTHQARMREAGFLVGRAFPPMESYNRVSIGLPEEMHRFVEVLRDFRARSWI